MNICGMQKLSLLDYPGYTAATIFTGGCNLRCGFCHNSALVTAPAFPAVMSREELFGFLKKRHGLLDGVCISGGEPLLQHDISDFLFGIKALGFKVKLDTNGCFPEKLAELINEGVLDYIAMDIKNCKEKYPQTVGVENFDVLPVLESIKIVMESGLSYEFRTTIVREFHTVEDIEKIGLMIKGAERYFLQNFVDSGSLIEPGHTPADPEEMKKMLATVSRYVKYASIRGVD